MNLVLRKRQFSSSWSGAMEVISKILIETAHWPNQLSKCNRQFECLSFFRRPVVQIAARSVPCLPPSQSVVRSAVPCLHFRQQRSSSSSATVQLPSLSPFSLSLLLNVLIVFFKRLSLAAKEIFVFLRLPPPSFADSVSQRPAAAATRRSQTWSCRASG